jgi:diguanylate cyclase (GGDEF)-like protein/PAS domain S-box-containing protein
LAYFCETIYLANNGEDGLRLYKEHLPDIVVTDIRMPQMDGVEMSKLIRNLNREQHIIYTTAFDEVEYLKEAIENHIDAYIVKPIDLDELENRLQRLITTINLEKKLKEKQDELEAIFNTTRDGIAILDLKSNFMLVNQAYVDITGFSKEELLQKSCIELSITDDREGTFLAIERVKQDGSMENFEKRCFSKSGAIITVNLSMALMPDGKHIVIGAKDITESKRKELLLKEHNRLISQYIMIANLNFQKEIQYISKAFLSNTELTQDECIGKKYREILSPTISKVLYGQIWDEVERSGLWEGELKVHHTREEFIWVKTSVTFRFDDQHQKIGYTAIMQDITEKKVIEKLSVTDELTGLFNRRHFNEKFPEIINRAKRKDDLIAFMIIDIDFFKQFNDTYGHQEGDNALRRVAQAIKGSLRRVDDYSFRLGGEEFGVIFEPNTKEEAYSFAEVLRKCVEKLQIEHSQSNISKWVTISAGLFIEKAHLIDTEEAYRGADDSLYKAKSLGRNRVI